MVKQQQPLLQQPLEKSIHLLQICLLRACSIGTIKDNHSDGHFSGNNRSISDQEQYKEQRNINFRYNFTISSQYKFDHSKKGHVPLLLHVELAEVSNSGEGKHNHKNLPLIYHMTRKKLMPLHKGHLST